MTIKSKFLIGAAIILLIFCVGVSLVAYFYLKDVATKDIYKDTEILIATADATRTYVKDVLRPTVSDLIPKESFIPHAGVKLWDGSGNGSQILDTKGQPQIPPIPLIRQIHLNCQC